MTTALGILFFRVDELTFFGFIDLYRFCDQPRHRVILKRSGDIHGKADDVTRLDFRRSLVSGSGEERGLLSRTAAGDRAYDVTCMDITAMSPPNRTFLSLFKSFQAFLTASVSTPECFSDVLVAANLTDELISDTCAATRPFSASATDQTFGVIALSFF